MVLLSGWMYAPGYMGRHLYTMSGVISASGLWRVGGGGGGWGDKYC